jgi:hypothetical protein
VEWQTIAAVWGAGLSTFLALSRLLPEWPLVTLESGSPPRNFHPAWVRIRIMNWSKRSLVIVKMDQFSLGRGGGRIEFFHELDIRNEGAAAQEIKFAQRSFDTELLVRISGENSVVVRIAAISADNSHLLVFWWHRHWFLGFSLPLCVRVSARLARQINGA